ncbi:hypothetical protein GCM10007159_07780 [Modicisalibacter luteus]|nr:hypothetical protein GCM10007159_07780 [Halomonas lutea]
MLAIFLAIALVAIAVAFMQSATYTYTSLYSIAEAQDAEGEPVPLEAPSALLARLRLQIQPSEVREFLQANQWGNLPFDLVFSQPQGTDLIALTSNAPEDLQTNVENLHRAIMKVLAQTQLDLVERTEQSLDYRLEGLRSAIRQVGVVDGNLSVEVNQLEARLAAIRPGGVSQLAVRSLEPKGIAPWALVLISAVAGLVLAILAAFSSHFAFAVRQRLATG